MTPTAASKPVCIGCFISPHGFGHAARAAAVMEALNLRAPNTCFDIYTSVPQWFFSESLSGSFTYNYIETDIGLVQLTPMQEDLTATVEKLDIMLPFEDATIALLAEKVLNNNCRLILCDIAPMGIAVARVAGVASVLVENFTWDWVYQGYAAQHHRIVPHADYLRHVFSSADYHIQTQPVCCPGAADLTTRPVSRQYRTSPLQVRQHLKIPLDASLAILTLGGIPPDFELFKKLPTRHDLYVLIPGGAETYQAIDNIRLLPHHSDYYHPDLIRASDAVIGKLGYSTLAEVFHAGIPFGYITRLGFRESAVLEAFVKEHMQGLPLAEAELEDGSWMDCIPDLLTLPKIKRQRVNGADQVAEYIFRLLNSDN